MIQFYGFAEHVVSLGILDGVTMLVVFVYVQEVAGLNGSPIGVRHVIVLIPISRKTCLLGQVVFLLEIFSVEPHEIVCEFGLSVLPVVILIGRDGAHHSLTTVSLYAEFVFLHSVLDSINQLLFLFFGGHLFFLLFGFGFLFQHLLNHDLIQTVNDAQQQSMTTTYVVAHSYQCCDIKYEFDFKHWIYPSMDESAV